jgi:adenine-specific DNA-methyltransferase
MLPYTDDVLSRYKNPDNDSRGPWQSVALSVQGGHGTRTQFYSIKTPGGRVIAPPSGLCWRFTEDKLNQLISDNRIWFGVDGNNVPRLKLFLSEVEQGLTPHTLWNSEEVGTNDSAKREVNALFDNVSVFDTPKPTLLIKRLLQICSQKKDYIILDFFSGSATVAHAVLRTNSEDNGSRKYIQVQLPERLSDDNVGRNLGFDNLCEVGKERIRRAAKKIKEETGAAIDYGFRVYRLDSSNMQDVYYKPQAYSQAQLDAFADNVKPDRNADDLLAQIMLDWGLPLSLKIGQAAIGGKLVFKVAQNSLYACFDKGIDEAFAKVVAQESPLRIVFRDNGFKNDTAKINVKQLLKQLSPETEMKVI